MRMIFENCMVVKVFPSAAKPGRVYVDVIDFDDGRTFNFSTDDWPYVEAMKSIQVIGSLSAKMSAYLFQDKHGQSKQQFKATEIVFKPSQNGNKK